MCRKPGVWWSVLSLMEHHPQHSNPEPQCFYYVQHDKEGLASHEGGSRRAVSSYSHMEGGSCHFVFAQEVNISIWIRERLCHCLWASPRGRLFSFHGIDALDALDLTLPTCTTLTHSSLHPLPTHSFRVLLTPYNKLYFLIINIRLYVWLYNNTPSQISWFLP